MGRLRHIHGGIGRIGRDPLGYQLAQQAPNQPGVNLDLDHAHTSQGTTT